MKTQLIDFVGNLISDENKREPYSIKLIPETELEKKLCTMETTELKTVSMFLHRVCCGMNDNPCVHKDVCLTYDILKKNDIGLSILFFQDCEKKQYHSENWVKWRQGKD